MQAREHLARATHEALEQRELLGRQLDRGAAASTRIVFDIEPSFGWCAREATDAT